MRYLIILLGAVCLAFMLLPTCAPAPEPEPEAASEPVFDQAAEEAAIREVIEQTNAAWNKHDMEAFSVFVNEDAESWDGAQDKAAILKDTSQSWDRQKDVQWKVTEEIGIVFVTPDVAIYKVRCESTG